MVEEDAVRRVIAELDAARASVSCSDMARLLESLGFSIKDARKPGHKVYLHDGLAGFHADSYTCGHGRNPTLKPVYVRKVIKVLRRYERELSEWLERGK